MKLGFVKNLKKTKQKNTFLHIILKYSNIPKMTKCKLN